MSLFDQVEAPNIVMLGTSITGQHALSHEVDNTLNTYLNDKFTFHFYNYLKQQVRIGGNKKTKLSDLPKLFPSDKISSDVRIKSTHTSKTLD